jgi:hypothetical protein
MSATPRQSCECASVSQSKYGLAENGMWRRFLSAVWNASRTLHFALTAELAPKTAQRTQRKTPLLAGRHGVVARYESEIGLELEVC